MSRATVRKPTDAIEGLLVRSSLSMALWLTTPTTSWLPRARTGPPESPGQTDATSCRVPGPTDVIGPPGRTERWMPSPEGYRRVHRVLRELLGRVSGA